MSGIARALIDPAYAAGWRDARAQAPDVDYDADDRTRCICRDHSRESWGVGAIDNDGGCLNVTRHPTGKCRDCRETARAGGASEGRRGAQGVQVPPADPRSSWPVDHEEGE